MAGNEMPTSRKEHSPNAGVMEATFHHMQTRKVERQRNGTYSADKPFVTLWVFLTLLLMVGAAAPSFTDGNFQFDFELKIREIGFISVSVLLFGTFLVYSLTRVVVVVRWSLYWLLLAEAMLWFLKRDLNLLNPKTPFWLQISFIVAEFFTFFLYSMVHYAYPAFVRSDAFKKHIGIASWWAIHHTAPWTMTYHSSLWPFRWGDQRSTCSYRGAVDSMGRPHGYGHWMDDHFHGEILTGWWENGLPVGPFRSREYGSGYAFSKCMLAYFIAIDDAIERPSWFTTQEKRPRIGVAGVECSISGEFFSHLPKKDLLYGPYTLVSSNDRSEGGLIESSGIHEELKKTATIPECISSIRHLSIQHPLSKVNITTNLTHGLTVAGHVYEPTGEISTKQCTRLVIDVIPPSNFDRIRSNASTSQGSSSITFQENSLARPKGDKRFYFSSANAVERVYSTSAGQDRTWTSDYPEYSTPPETPGLHSSLNLPEFQDDLNLAEGNAALTQPLLKTSLRKGSPPSYGTTAIEQDNDEGEETKMFRYESSSSNGPIQDGFDTSRGHFQPIDENNLQSIPHLRVNGWKSSVEGHAEALIFFPGFNASTKTCLQRLGQFVTIAKLPAYIKPVVFVNVGCHIMTYLRAVEVASSKKSQEALCELLDGLLDAGIRNVHLLTHSMGVQTLMAAFADTPEGERSMVSKRFVTVDEMDRGSRSNSENGSDSSSVSESRAKLLHARTITVLNGDYPLASFVNSGFSTLRLVCDVITIVGNRKDAALLWSDLGNGIMYTLDHYLGSKNQPDHMRIGIQESDEDTFDTGKSCCTTDRDSWCSGCCCSRNRTGDELQGRDRIFGRQLTVGKEIYCLYDSKTKSELEYAVENGDPWKSYSDAMHRNESSSELRATERELHQRVHRRWLDLDAIDTTWMDTNVHFIRHNYFNLNSVLMEDLRELILTGRRASERTLLLHREGNIYSYCQAPSCVVNK